MSKYIKIKNRIISGITVAWTFVTVASLVGHHYLHLVYGEPSSTAICSAPALIIFLAIYLIGLLFLYLFNNSFAYFITNIEEKTNQLQDSSTKYRRLSIKYKNMLKERMNFVRLMVHDVRTPFNSIIGLTDCLLSDDTLADYHRQYIEVINHTCESTFLLFNNVLEYTLSNTSDFKLKFEMIMLHDLIQKTKNLHTGNLKQKNIQVRTTFNEKTWIKSDRHLIEAIVRNLLNNAIKFSYNDDYIDFHVHIGNNESKIIISDYGVGMTDFERESLLTKAHWESEVGTTNNIGRGLGLQIVNSSIKRLNGNIEFKNNSPKGTKVIVTLPN